jgi:hypothetical protein
MAGPSLSTSPSFACGSFNDLHRRATRVGPSPACSDAGGSQGERRGCPGSVAWRGSQATRRGRVFDVCCTANPRCVQEDPRRAQHARISACGSTGRPRCTRRAGPRRPQRKRISSSVACLFSGAAHSLALFSGGGLLHHPCSSVSLFLLPVSGVHRLQRLAGAGGSSSCSSLSLAHALLSYDELSCQWQGLRRAPSTALNIEDKEQGNI